MSERYIYLMGVILQGDRHLASGASCSSSWFPGRSPEKVKGLVADQSLHLRLSTSDSALFSNAASTRSSRCSSEAPRRVGVAGKR